MFLAWETLAITKGLFFFDFGVEFTDVKFLRATTLQKDTELEFTIVVHPGTGRFEIAEGDSALVTGFVSQTEKPQLTDVEERMAQKTDNLLNRDFYKELRLRGYHYSGLFRSVEEASANGLYGKVKWSSNWIAFLDCLLQIQILGQDTRCLILPTSIQRMIIDTPKQLQMVADLGEENASFEVFVLPELKTIRSGGVEIVNLQANVVARRRPPGVPVLEYSKFIPYYDTPTLDIVDAARVIVQLALENFPSSKIKAVEIDGNIRKTILPQIRNALDDLPLVTPELILLSSRNVDDESDVTTENSKITTQHGCYFVIASDCVNNVDLLLNATSSFGEQGFFICREFEGIQMKNVSPPENFSIISSINTEDEIFIILKYSKVTRNYLLSKSVHVSNSDIAFEWIEKVKSLMKIGPVVLVSENDPTSGVIGLVNCLRKEPAGLGISCVLIDDKHAIKFNIKEQFYQKQIALGLGINILKNGIWGSYRHLQIKKSLTERSALDHSYVNALIKSDLSSIKWISGPFNYSLPKKELVNIQFAALNFRDVMLATGKLSADVFAETRLEHECVLGMEYSGVTTNGRRVMGMTMAAAMVTISYIKIKTNKRVTLFAGYPC